MCASVLCAVPIKSKKQSVGTLVHNYIPMNIKET